MSNPSTLTLLGGIASIVIGLLTCFYGYRVFRVVLALVGFIFGFSLGLALTGGQADMTGLIVALFAGLIGAVVMWAIYSIGVVISGALFGGALAVALLGAFNLESDVLAALVFVVGLILGGLLALVFRDIMIVIGTALSGAVTTVYGISRIMPELFGVVAPNRLPNAPLALLAVLALMLVGIAVQMRAFQEDAPRRRR